VIWTATLVANIGVWMYSAAAGWLMATLTANALMVSLVQVAATLPMFLLALPAGALADILDARRLLIVVEASIIVICVPFAVLVGMGLITPITLIAFTFLIEAASAMAAPAWQSIVPRLVPREELAPAIAANSVSVNISRALGPALGGILTAIFGMAAPFWVNAFSNLGSIGALLWWRPPKKAGDGLPAERIGGAMRAGMRYARNNRALRATFVRAFGFFLFGSAYWALLPLVARTQIAGGPQLYGMLLGAIGVGAIAGSFAMPRLKSWLGADGLVAAGQAGTAAALCLFAIAREPATALLAGVLAGACWIAAVASLNVSAQVALPEWVRARGLGMHVAVSFGTMALGSAMWGETANLAGLESAHFIAAAGALLAIPLTWACKLQQAAGLDLTPSMHWPTPLISDSIGGDDGPVLVSIEYRIDPKDRTEFIVAFDAVARQRRRDGGYAWGLFEDATDPERFVETFQVESWNEHLRQHERVTHADRAIEERVQRLAIGTPRVSHLIAAR
jgi:MFS family permease